MLRFAPTESGGRVAEGDGPHGSFYIEWASDGSVIKQSIDIRQPTAVAATSKQMYSDMSLIPARRAACEVCPDDKCEELTKFFVMCGCKSGCASRKALRLDSSDSRCPNGYWPIPDASVPTEANEDAASR